MSKHAIFLFDESGVMLEPWLDAGFECWQVDLAHGPDWAGVDYQHQGRLHKVKHDLTVPWMPPIDRSDIAFVSAFPPCDHLSVSGARWFKGKGLRKLAHSIELFATASEICEWSGAPYLIENPVSNISSHWRKSDYNFHPCHFTRLAPDENYTKKTCLWTGGGFVMPDIQQDATLGLPDDRIHKAPPGNERAKIRSQTPKGFSQAVFEANCKELVK